MKDPTELLYSWQAILCAVSCVALSGLVKRSVDARIGAEARRANAFLSDVVIPTIPLCVGAAYAIVVPMHPEVLTAYIADHELVGFSRIVSLASWGAACGQFSAWIYDRTEKWIKGTAGQR